MSIRCSLLFLVAVCVCVAIESGFWWDLSMCISFLLGSVSTKEMKDLYLDCKIYE